ncbi:MAG: hypothetical protein QOI11_3895 [Candidatus Eremiobacteraeota bacterium]|jgi:hypothetical protein|nr:hypothetical protein [Candidatus Eremiobacteraeota bacterium]
MRRAPAVCAFVLAACAAAPLAASARATVALDGGTLVFFSDTLSIVARDGATLRLADGTLAHGDAAYVDLKRDRAVLAGHATVARGGAAAGADAIALDLDGERVDLLAAAGGAITTTRARLAAPLLGPPAPGEIDGERFAFPEVDDRFAYIRAKHAAITPHADVRFSPAAFPTSVGGLPVPSYLYTYASAAGFGATSLPGATFDQPYGLVGSPTSLTALHARWLDGTGPSVGLQQQLVSGDDAYLAASLDAPLRGSGTRGLSGYRRMGARYTATVGASSGFGVWGANASLGAAFGPAGGRLSYGYGSGGFSTFDASLRTPDRPLFGGATWRLRGDVGFDALRRGSLLTASVPDARRYSTIWRHGLDLFVAAPVVRGPLGTRIGTTVDAARTWYAYPHHDDTLSANVFVSRELSRKVALFGGYQASWNARVYPGAQGLFFPPAYLPEVAPDGTPWFGRSAYSGASTFRDESVALQLTPNLNTALRVAVHHYADFPQFHGYGRPQWSLETDARLRPFPNIGLQVGRAYDFGWGGYRWVPRWTFAITP